MWNRRTATSAALLAALTLCSGCLNTVFVASRDAHVTTRDTGEGRPFIVRAKNNFTVWGNFPRIRVIEVDRLVGQHTGRKITKITGLRMAQHTTFVDGLLTFITFGLYSPRTLVIQGRMTGEPATPPIEDEGPPATPGQGAEDGDGGPPPPPNNAGADPP